MKEADNERQMIREVAVKTAQKLLQPRAAEIDATGEYPKDLIDAFGRQGLLAVVLPEEYGGTQGDLLSFCYVIEELARVCGSSALLVLAQGAGSFPILIGGNPSQQERHFSRIAESNALAAFALCEAGGVFDPGSLTMKAETSGKEVFLTGRKDAVTLGGVADLYTVFARGETKGLSAFVVEAGTSGLHVEKRLETIGMRGVPTADVTFDRCRILQENRLGEEGKGGDIARKTLHRLGTGAGALAVGLAQGAFEYAVGYAGERVQFGKPVSSFQAMRFVMADLATLIEAARALVYKAATHVEGEMDRTERLSSAAKIYASDVAMKVTTDGVQILGGYGYMKDYPMERMMRDAKVIQVYGGANQIQRQVVAQHLFER